GEDLQKTVYGAKYVVVPSLWHDNAPNVVYESFAAGKPVIATALGGLREQVTDQTGILVEPKNYEQLAEALDRLSSSSDLVVQLGQNARELVEQKHTIEAHTEHLIQLFNSVKGTV
ncbi:MAG TPA: glycosyltransferase family 4 protein, partial [Armatimonadota bacterium]|nr:glycosyltransferase family 4 protein [Armatimonadota bacterium]